MVSGRKGSNQNLADHPPPHTRLRAKPERGVGFNRRRELWSVKLDASAHAVPVTYLGKNGKQYVAIVAGGNGTLDDATPGVESLAVFALP